MTVIYTAPLIRGDYRHKVFISLKCILRYFFEKVFLLQHGHNNSPSLPHHNSLKHFLPFHFCPACSVQSQTHLSKIKSPALMDYFCPAEFTCSSASSPSSSSAAVASYNGKAPASGIFDSSASAVRFQPNLHGMSMDWTPEEQAILEEGLVKYASESSIVRYAKIAMHLDNKTIRDVALRCRWLTKRDVSKRRKEDVNVTRKNKDRKEKLLDPSAVSSQGVMQSGFPSYAQMLTNDNGISYNAINGVTWQLLRQNAQTFEQISANLATHQVNENIGLLCRARDNILQILSNLSDPPNTGKHMPPLPVKVDEELANFILPTSTLRMQ